MKDFSTKNLIIVVVSIVIGFAIALIAPPEGLDVIGMRYIGIFVGLLIVLSTNALPAWAASLGALVLMVVAGCGKIPEVFSAFSGSIVWLMIAVFAFSAAVINSGLMTRIALSLLKVFPKNYFGQVLSLMVVGTILSPMIPSSNAKVNLLAPIATEMTKAVGYEKKSKPALGLFTAAFIPPYIGSHAFLTGNANVAYMVGLMGITFTWIGYFQLAALWLVILLVLTFVYCMTYCKPSEKIDLPDGFFAEKYKELGKMTFGEKVSAIVVVLCLVFWIGQPVFGIDAGMVTMVGVVILTMFGVLNTKAFQTQIPWGLIMFIGALIGGSGLMGKLGVSDFIAANIGPLLAPVVSSVWVFVPALLVVTWVLRAFIPANGVPLLICLAIFGPLCEQAGISLFVLCFVEYVAGNIWFNSFQNPFVLGCLGVAGNEYVTIKEFKKSAYAYMLISLVSMMASIPVWSLAGLC